jgi:hypothetical protein
MKRVKRFLGVEAVKDAAGVEVSVRFIEFALLELARRLFLRTTALRTNRFVINTFGFLGLYHRGAELQLDAETHLHVAHTEQIILTQALAFRLELSNGYFRSNSLGADTRQHDQTLR